MAEINSKVRTQFWNRETVALTLFSTLLLTVGCGGKQGNTALAAAPPAPPVTVAVAKQEAIPIQINAIGNAQPYRTVDVKPMVAGQIERVLFAQGDYVHKGQVLFKLDPRPFQAALDQALGNLAKDRATAADQKADANRDDALLKAGVIAVQVAQQQQALAQSGAATVQADEAAVETARVNLGYTDIKAPIDGRAGAILVNVGNVVQTNTTNPLTVINQISPIYVQFNIPEAQLPEIQKHKLGMLNVEAYPPNQPDGSQGKLTFINNAVDPTTGTIQLMGTFPNRDQKLWPGQFLNVVLQLGENPKATVVPATAIQTGQQGTYVYVVQSDGMVVMRPVKTSLTYRQLAVVESGAAPGDRVIVDGQIRVVPDHKVNVTKTVPTVPGEERLTPGGQNANNGGGQGATGGNQ
jgi:multidrug efflux system membrane fusion protein